VVPIDLLVSTRRKSPGRIARRVSRVNFQGCASRMARNITMSFSEGGESISALRRSLQKGLWLRFESLGEVIGRYTQRFHNRGGGVGLMVMPGQNGQHPGGTLQPQGPVVVSAHRLASQPQPWPSARRNGSTRLSTRHRRIGHLQTASP